MTDEDPTLTISYEGKRAVVVGCYSGMGAAVANALVRAGAEVHGADLRAPDYPLASFQSCDLRDPESIAAAAGGITGQIDALFNCAGIPQTGQAPMDTMKVNFIGMRAFTDAVVDQMVPGSAVANIASSVGFDYLRDLALTLELVQTEGYAAAVEWCEAHEELVAGGYKLSKEAVIAWTMFSGAHLIHRGIRINCISPGPTVTPMMAVFEGDIGAQMVDAFTEPIRRRSTPEEQAAPLLFLNSDLARYVNGENLFTDGGFNGAVTSRAIDLMALMSAAQAAPPAN